MCTQKGSWDSTRDETTSPRATPPSVGLSDLLSRPPPVRLRAMKCRNTMRDARRTSLRAEV
eukprot:4351757-Pyramimonas_sp.AAC.1